MIISMITKYNIEKYKYDKKKIKTEQDLHIYNLYYDLYTMKA